MVKPTAVDDNLVSALLHGCCVIALIQLAEDWQGGRAHPDLERFPLLQIWRWVLLCVVTGKAFRPVWWGDNFVWLVICLAVQSLVAVPCNVGVVVHCIHARLVAVVADSAIGVQKDGAVIRVVEHGVGNQATWVVGLLGLAVAVQRIALATVNLVVAERLSIELLGVKRVDIAAVVLVKVGHVVVEENGRAHAFRDVKLQVAAGAVSRHGCVAGDDGNVFTVFLGPLGVDGAVVALESKLDVFRRHIFEPGAILDCRCAYVAVCIVEADLLDLIERGKRRPLKCAG